MAPDPGKIFICVGCVHVGLCICEDEYLHIYLYTLLKSRSTSVGEYIYVYTCRGIYMGIYIHVYTCIDMFIDK